ncbi:hypothetical protein Z169_11088, partial [Egretta garzetta]
VHFFTYDREFITQYCQASALLELESLLSQQSLREAFSDAELSTAKQRHQQVQDYIQGSRSQLGQDLLCLRLGQRSTGVRQRGERSEPSLDPIWFEPSARVAGSQAEPLSAPLAPLADSHGLSDEEGSSEVFLATDSDYDSSRAQSPKELDLVSSSSSGPECCSRRVARTLRDSAPDVLQTHELK